MHRYINACVFAGALLASAASLFGVKIENGYSREMVDVDFQRISEFFTGQENTTGRLILRTQPDSRDGLYFVLLLDQSATGLTPAHTIKAEVIRTDKSLPVTFQWSVPAHSYKSKEVLLGLTGADWDSENLGATAWRITFLDQSGNQLAEYPSYLWQLPTPDKK